MNLKILVYNKLRISKTGEEFLRETVFFKR